MLSPTKKTKSTFDKLVTWVETFERLPKRLDGKRNVDPLDQEEHKLAYAMKRWDGEILGPERFHVFEGLWRRYGTSLNASHQRLDAWFQENCRLPRLRSKHGRSAETARDEDLSCAGVETFEGS